MINRFILGFFTILTFTGNFVVNAQEVLIPAPPELAASSYLLIDADTETVLVEHKSDLTVPPASLTKMMTSYIVSSEIERGRVSDDDMVNVSVKAWRKGGSKMFIREGTQVALKDLLRGVIIQSGNDASIALAEHIAGSEEAFVDIMNQKAALMGLNDTHFENATGWPAEAHRTTAHDLAILARALIYDFPEHYRMYAEKSFSYNGITQANRNRLLFRDETVDGLKTGHTEEAGYCLVASAKRDDMRLIAVVMGTNGEESRAAETQKLLAYGFRYFQVVPVNLVSEVLGTGRVWYGKLDEVKLGIAEDIKLTLAKGMEQKLQRTIEIDKRITAPITAGQQLGKMTIQLHGEVLAGVPLVAQHAVERAGFFARMVDRAKLFYAEL